MAETLLDQGGSPRSQLAGKRTDDASPTLPIVDCALCFVERCNLLVLRPSLTGLMALRAPFAIPPSFTARSADAYQRMESQTLAAVRLIERRRAFEPAGRTVVQMTPKSSDLPDLATADGERTHVPGKPTAVGVFENAFSAATYLHSLGRTIEDCLRLAGSSTKGANVGSVFNVRANGNIISSRQRASLFKKSGDPLTRSAKPGDEFFIPKELTKNTFLLSGKEKVQTLFQFGLEMAGMKSATR